MLGLYLEGILLGGICAFFVGPVLFTLLDASLQGGFQAGARVALGIALSDVVAIALVIAGLGPILTHPAGAQALGLAGGLILLCFGGALAWQANALASEGARLTRDLFEETIESQKAQTMLKREWKALERGKKRPQAH